MKIQEFACCAKNMNDAINYTKGSNVTLVSQVILTSEVKRIGKRIIHQ